MVNSFKKNRRKTGQNIHKFANDDGHVVLKAKA